MAVILAQSAAITKSRLEKGFNGDSLNLNGRVVSLENADKGFKAAGSVKPPYISVMASGNRKGFAAGAVDAFNDFSKELCLNKYNAQSIINRYFDAMDAVIQHCGIPDNHLSIGIVCAFEDCVVAAKSGGCHILRFSDGELFEIALSEDEDGRGFQFIDVVAHGDIFALTGEECSKDLDYDGIVNIFDADGELKEMLRSMYSLLAAGAKGQDCSLVLIKLETDTDRTFAAVPIGDAEPTSDDYISDEASSFDAQAPIDAAELVPDEAQPVSDEETPKNGKSPTMKKKILSFIPIAVLVIILAVAVALYFATRPNNPLSGTPDTTNGSTSNSGSIVVEPEDGTVIDLNGSNGMQTVDDNNNGGNPNNLVNSDETTRRADTETTTRRTQPSTAAPSTAAPTTEATTVAPSTEATTVAPVTDPVTTTEAQVETTTAASDPEPDDGGEETPDEPVAPDEPVLDNLG